MPDYNKGDFTQQGVNGHVNATVRLNEKRLVSIDLTSNEEAEGCTITGSVKDLLNDKVYAIGSGGGGGGGDFSTATVTITNTTEENYFVPIPQVTERKGMQPAMIQSGINVATGTSATIAVPLYHNTCFARVYDNSFSFTGSTGDISIMGGNQVLIQGDGTLTI